MNAWRQPDREAPPRGPSYEASARPFYEVVGFAVGGAGDPTEVYRARVFDPDRETHARLLVERLSAEHEDWDVHVYDVRPARDQGFTHDLTPDEMWQRSDGWL